MKSHGNGKEGGIPHIIFIPVKQKVFNQEIIDGKRQDMHQKSFSEIPGSAFSFFIILIYLSSP